jgi:hypothetical protein
LLEQGVGSELELDEADRDAIARPEHGRHTSLDTHAVEARSVRARVDDIGNRVLRFDPYLEVIPGDHHVVDDKTLVVVDAGHLATDEQAVVDRDLALFT